MKNNKVTIILPAILIISVISVILNIILLIKIDFSSKNENNIEIPQVIDTLPGIYQTQYYNMYNKSMTITVKLYDDGTCKFSHYITESSSEDDCTWSKQNNTIILKDNNDSTATLEILSSGNLLYSNHELKKIS